MSDPSQAAPESPSGGTTEPEVVSPDLVSPEQAESTDQEAPEVEPAKIIRIGGMVKQLLEEVRNTTLDEAARDSLRDIYENSLTELRSALSPDLDAELERLTLDFDDDTIPSEAQLRIAKADEKNLTTLAERIHKRVQAKSFSKTDFALALLAEDPSSWSVPTYIAEGLSWLETEIAPPEPDEDQPHEGQPHEDAPQGAPVAAGDEVAA